MFREASVTAVILQAAIVCLATVLLLLQSTRPGQSVVFPCLRPTGVWVGEVGQGESAPVVDSKRPPSACLIVLLVQPSPTTQTAARWGQVEPSAEIIKKEERVRQGPI